MLGFTIVLFLELPKIYADASICLQQTSVSQLSSFPSGYLHANITEISCFPRELAIFEIDLKRPSHRKVLDFSGVFIRSTSLDETPSGL